MTGGGHAYTTTDLDRWPECGRWSSGCSEMHKMEPCWCTDRLRSAKAHPWVLSIMINHFFPTNSKTLLCRLALVRSGAASTPGSGGFRRVPVQIPVEVPGGSGADTWWGSGGFRFWRVPVQIPAEVPEGFGADTLLRFRRVPVQIPCSSSRGFRCRCLVRFWRVPVQVPGKVPESSGADAFGNSKGFLCF